MLRASFVCHSRGNVLIFGAAGAMGRGVLSAFQAKGWETVAVDLAKPATASSLDNYITLPGGSSAEKELEHVVRELRRSNRGDFAAVINAAGGWAGGGASDAAIAAQTQLMWQQSVRSSILCSHIALTMGTKDVLLVLTGAAAAANGATPGMLAYGTAKSAVQHITKSVAAELQEKKSDKAAAVCILPVTIDTPGNRAGMPGADFSNWTPVSEIAGKITSWAAREQPVPSLAFVEVATTKGRTSWTVRNL